MNAFPISMNTANGASATDVSNSPSGKSSALPAFAQVLANKQSLSPKISANSSATASPSQNTNASQVNSKSQAQPATPAQPSAPPALKKADSSTKPPTDSQAKQTAATAASTGARGAMLALVPAVNPIAIYVTPADPKPATPFADTPSAQNSLTPVPENNATATPVQSQQVSQDASVPSQSSAPLSNDLPLSPSNSSQSPLGTALSDATPIAATPQPSTPSAATSTEPATLQATSALSSDMASPPPPSLIETSNHATDPALDTPSPKNLTGDAGKAQATSLGNHKSSVSDLFRNFAAAAEKTVDAVAHVTATVAHDVAGAIKEKASSNGISPASAVPANAAAKSQQASTAKEESLPNPSSASARTDSSKNAGDSGDATGSNDSSNSENTGASPESSAKAKASAAETVAPQPAQSSQASAGNSASAQVPAISAIPSAKEPATSAEAASAAQENTPTTPPDPDDAKLSSLDSKVINVAQLSGNDVHSEVRIAMQADQLGQVELHATLNGQQLGAAISVEKKEAHAAMAAELPSLQQALEARNLRVNEVVLSQSAMHSTSNDAGKGGNAAPDQRPNLVGRQYQLPDPQNNLSATPTVNLETAAIFDGHGRLSVRV